MAEHEQRAGCAKDIQAALESTRSAHHRIDGIEDDIAGIKSDNKILHEMNTNIAVLASNYENQSKKVDCIESDVKELKEKPAKRWDLVLTIAITAVVTYLISLVLK